MFLIIAVKLFEKFRKKTETKRFTVIMRIIKTHAQDDRPFGPSTPWKTGPETDSSVSGLSEILLFLLDSRPFS